MTSPESSPLQDLEILAAFIDGRLSEAERRQVEERLAQDEDFYEIYSETLQTLEEEAAEPSSQRSGDQRSRTAAILPLAAAVLLAVGALSLSNWFGNRLGTVEPDGVESSLKAMAELNLQVLDPTTRSGGGGELLQSTELPIHLGVHHLDLQVALELGDWGAAAHSSWRLKEETGTGPVFISSSTIFADLNIQLPRDEAREPPSEAVSQWRQGVEAQGEVFETTFQRLGLLQLYRLGRWVESCRLAAVGQDQALLQKRLHSLKAAMKIVAMHYPDDTELEEILLEIEALKSDDFSAHAQQLQRLLLKLGKRHDGEY